MKKRVLILCKHNAVRSQICEAVVNKEIEGWIAVSAGSEPLRPDPLVLQILKDNGYGTEGLRSKHVDEVIDGNFDLIITVCDEAESCVNLLNKVPKIRFPLQDPLAFNTNEESQRKGLIGLIQEIRSELPKILNESY